MTTGTVYLIQEPRGLLRDGVVVPRDLSSANRYGKIFPILHSKAQPSDTPGPTGFDLMKALRPFNPENDYLCYAGGDPLGLGLALLALRANGLREIYYLKWDRERDTTGKAKPGGFYVPIRINLNIQ